MLWCSHACIMQTRPELARLTELSGDKHNQMLSSRHVSISGNCQIVSCNFLGVFHCQSSERHMSPTCDRVQGLMLHGAVASLPLDLGYIVFHHHRSTTTTSILKSKKKVKILIPVSSSISSILKEFALVLCVALVRCWWLQVFRLYGPNQLVDDAVCPESR